jgi:DNA topoisomerase-1
MQATPPSDLEEALKDAHLRYISDSNPGITRKKYGEDFIYLDPQGHKVITDNTLHRINNLVIPPAWEQVWISPSPSSYLQATGIDAKGRKQYLYHPDWIATCQENKFSKMVFFGTVLPELRAKVASDIRIPRLERAKILGTVVWLLEHTFIRVGNQEYVKANGSYGLTTLRRKHVNVQGAHIHFEFKGKSGVDHSVSLRHPTIAKILKSCIELPGYEIFQYIDEDGNRHVVDSQDVNDYLKSITGEDITAKDFRCYYIHPTVIDTYEKRLLIPHFDEILRKKRLKKRLTKEESAVLSLLKNYS